MVGGIRRKSSNSANWKDCAKLQDPLERCVNDKPIGLNAAKEAKKVIESKQKQPTNLTFDSCKSTIYRTKGTLLIWFGSTISIGCSEISLTNWNYVFAIS